MGFAKQCVKQLLEFIPKSALNDLVDKHKTDYRNKGFSSYEHFNIMVYAQLHEADSLRSICGTIASKKNRYKELSLEKNPSKSTLAYANKHRSWKLFEDAYHLVHAKAQGLLAEKYNNKKFDIAPELRRLISFDSTTITLSLSLFDWALYTTEKGGLKVHIGLGHFDYLPTMVHITEAKQHDVKTLESLELPKGSIIAADRGYVSFKLFFSWTSNGISFVVRPKESMNYRVIETFELPAPILKSPSDSPALQAQAAIDDSSSQNTLEKGSSQDTSTLPYFPNLHDEEYVEDPEEEDPVFGKLRDDYVEGPANDPVYGPLEETPEDLHLLDPKGTMKDYIESIPQGLSPLPDLSPEEALDIIYELGYSSKDEQHETLELLKDLNLHSCRSFLQNIKQMPRPTALEIIEALLELARRNRARKSYREKRKIANFTYDEEIEPKTAEEHIKAYKKLVKPVNSELPEFIVVKDEKIEFTSSNAQKMYPWPLRLVTVFIFEKYHGKSAFMSFLTNNFELSADKIAFIYHERWRVETFFKLIKQNLVVKTFYGTSENAVRIQIFAALIATVIIKYLRDIAKYRFSFANFISILRKNMFENISIEEMITNAWEQERAPPPKPVKKLVFNPLF
jgi:hypothetical protein